MLIKMKPTNIVLTKNSNKSTLMHNKLTRICIITFTKNSNTGKPKAISKAKNKKS